MGSGASTLRLGTPARQQRLRRVPNARSGAASASEREVVRRDDLVLLYSVVDDRSSSGCTARGTPSIPAEAREFLADFPGPWWVVGGWAVEAFSGVHRAHHDVDVAIFQYDVPALLDLVGDRYDVWSVSSGSLRPINETWPEPPPDAGQVWLREHGRRPG